MENEIEKKQAAIMNELNKPLTAVDRLRLLATEPDTFSFDADDTEAVVDHIEALEAALRQCQSVLAMFIHPDTIMETTVLNAYTLATAAESKARSLLPATVQAEPKPPFTFADPVRHAEWERHKAESKRRGE